jgi:hypothetical protein
MLTHDLPVRLELLLTMGLTLLFLWNSALMAPYKKLRMLGVHLTEAVMRCVASLQLGPNADTSAESSLPVGQVVSIQVLPEGCLIRGKIVKVYMKTGLTVITIVSTRVVVPDAEISLSWSTTRLHCKVRYCIRLDSGYRVTATI